MQKDDKQKTIYYINSAKPIELEYILFSLTPKTGLTNPVFNTHENPIRV